MQPYSTHKGFTLIEMLIYIAVLLSVLGVVITTLLSLRTVFERNIIERRVADAGTSILERITRETRNALAVNPTSVFETPAGILDLDQSPTTTRFYVTSGDVMVRTTIGAESSDIALDPPSIAVDSLWFTRYTTGTSTSTAIRTALTLSVSSRFASTTRVFYTTTVVRGLYE